MGGLLVSLDSHSLACKPELETLVKPLLSAWVVSVHYYGRCEFRYFLTRLVIDIVLTME